MLLKVNYINLIKLICCKGIQTATIFLQQSLFYLLNDLKWLFKNYFSALCRQSLEADVSIPFE